MLRTKTRRRVGRRMERHQARRHRTGQDSSSLLGLGFDFGQDTVRKNEQNGATDIGLSLMTIMSVMGTHSAISPSYATFASFFSRTEEERAIAQRTLLISLGAAAMTSLAVFLVFKRAIPAIAGGLAGLALFGLGMQAIYSKPPERSTMLIKRQEQMKDQGVSPTSA